MMKTDKIKKILSPCLLIVVLPIFTMHLYGWDDDAGWGDWDDTGQYDISGYLETTGLTIIPRSSDSKGMLTGFQNLLRLRVDFEPSSNISVTFEGEYLDRRGALNPVTRARMIGLPGDAVNNLQSGENANFFRFDYAYGDLSYKLLDLRVGRQPIAWGTAYAFNPTDLANPSLLSELTGVEPPGLTAIVSSITLGQIWAVEGYLGFEDRARTLGSATELIRFKDYPLGLRLRSFISGWDFAAGYIRAVELHQQKTGASQIVTEDNVALEFAGSVGSATVYGESTVTIDDTDTWGRESLNSALGFRYQITDDIGLQMEYHLRGQGESSKNHYDAGLRLKGGLAARDYLVSVLDFTVAEEDIQVVISALTNLNDRSVVLFPEIRYSFIQDLELKLGGSAFIGSELSEFDGRFEYLIDKEKNTLDIDVGRPQIYLTCTWYF